MRTAYLKQGGSNTAVLAQMSELEALASRRDVIPPVAPRTDEYRSEQQHEYQLRIAELEREMQLLKEKTRQRDGSLKREEFTRDQYTSSSHQPAPFYQSKRPQPFIERTSHRVSTLNFSCRTFKSNFS